MKATTTHTVAIEIDLDDVTAWSRTMGRSPYGRIPNALELVATSDVSAEDARAKIDRLLDRILAARETQEEA
jgi:hypothetical protein